jgi:integrase
MASVRKRTWKTGDVSKTAWVADYFDQSGKRRQKTFATRKAADQWLVAARHEVAAGIHAPASASITVAEAADLWLMQCEVDQLERASVMYYRQHAQHIVSLIGPVRLADLTPSRIPAFRNELIATGRSHTLARRILVSLGTLLAYAQSIGKIVRNVVREQPRRRSDGRHKRLLQVGVDIPNKDELRAMLGAASGWFRPMFVLAVFTGMRASELRGLTWSDVDFSRGEVTVRQRADRYGVIGSPKSSAGKRTIPLAPAAANALREWRLHQPGDGLCFPASRGQPRAINTLHTSGLAPLQRAAGIMGPGRKPKYGMHAFRHAAASLLIEQGFSPKRVQALMGHSTIQMTFDTYGHLFPSAADDQAAMRQLQARLVG